MKAAEIAHALGSADAEVRRRAVLAMPGVRDPGLGPALLRALGDSDWRVRTEAIRVGSEIAEPLGLLPELLSAARQDEEVGLRGAALEVLVRGGDKALNTLVGALSGFAQNERQRALEVLARSGDVRAVQALEGLDLAELDSDLAVIDALSQIGGREAELALRRRLGSSDAFARVAALDALNRLDALVPYAELAPLLSDRMTTRITLRAMGRCGGLQVVGPLLAALPGPVALASTAAIALERCSRSPEVRAALVRELRTASDALRARLRELGGRADEGAALSATRLLAHARDPGAIQAALGLLARGIAPSRLASLLAELGWEAVESLLDQAPAFAAHGNGAHELARELAAELQGAGAEPPDGLLDALERALAADADQTVAAKESEPSELARLLRPRSQGPVPHLSYADFQDLAALIRGSSGIHLGDDSRPLLERKIGERIQTLGLASAAEYRSYLREDPEGPYELDRAIDMVAVHETYFFREPSQLSAFQQEVLPELYELADPRRALTVWSAGCSSGEEVYTLAILLARSGLFSGWNVRVIGNDISRRVVQTARRGVYRGPSFRAMPKEYQQHFFDVNEGRQIEPSIRALCHFSRLNLLDGSRGAMVGRVDAIFCRNLLIYFDEAARRELISIFYDRLLPGGYLMLGHSESLLHLTTAFELVQLSTDLVYRKPRSAGGRTT